MPALHHVKRESAAVDMWRQGSGKPHPHNSFAVQLSTAAAKLIAIIANMCFIGQFFLKDSQRSTEYILASYRANARECLAAMHEARIQSPASN